MAPSTLSVLLAGAEVGGAGADAAASDFTFVAVVEALSLFYSKLRGNALLSKLMLSSLLTLVLSFSVLLMLLLTLLLLLFAGLFVSEDGAVDAFGIAFFYCYCCCCCCNWSFELPSYNFVRFVGEADSIDGGASASLLSIMVLLLLSFVFMLLLSSFAMVLLLFISFTLLSGVFTFLLLMFLFWSG